jgi:L-seryl-tRNA(Ser) seleniumtransferase
MPSETNIEALRSLPQVEELMHAPQLAALTSLIPRPLLVDCARKAIEAARKKILAGASGAADASAIADAAFAEALANLRPSLRRAINATGVVVHTNLGRSALADAAVDAVVEVARGYSTLEYDTETMARGSRHDHVEHLLKSLTGAEAAIAVNNNAAAVMMVLSEFAAGHEAIVSRGELVEIGGSFRVPDIMAQSNAHMVEVGTTNKTHAIDYERALTPDTAMLLKVHPSNYRMIGFTESVAKEELRRIADAENARRGVGGAAASTAPAATTGGQPASCVPVLVYEDQGSGALERLTVFGEYAEPTVRESLAAGCDLVSFSGDKLLGGPQAGIIVGRKDLIDRLKKNPLARALRLDKMTLAALEATLRLYLNPEEAMQQIPTLRMLTESADSVKTRAEALSHAIRKNVSARQAHLEVVPETGRAGGGSLPMCDIETFCVRMEPKAATAQDCERFLQQKRAVPIIARIKKEAVLFDARTITDAEIPEIAEAVGAFFETAADAAAAPSASGKPASKAKQPASKTKKKA